MWFSVAKGKDTEAHGGTFKGTKVYPAFIDIGDERLNPSPIPTCVLHLFSKTNEVLH